MTWLAKFALTLALSVWTGFVICVLWGWFAVPLGVHRVTLWQALGINLLINLFVLQVKDLDWDDMDEFQAKSWEFSAIVPALCLGFGAVYHIL